MDHSGDFQVMHTGGEPDAHKAQPEKDPTVQAGVAAREMNKADRTEGEFEGDSYVSGDAAPESEAEPESKEA